MIVQPRDGQLLLIRQTDHAALAGAFAEHWGNASFAVPAPRDPLIVAAAHHDDVCGGTGDRVALRGVGGLTGSRRHFVAGLRTPHTFSSNSYMRGSTFFNSPRTNG